jgi:hypothetical protein
MGYHSAVKSYEFFCAQVGLQAWPASIQSLAEWATGRATGKPIKFQGKVKPETIIGARNALVDRQYALTPFEKASGRPNQAMSAGFQHPKGRIYLSPVFDKDSRDLLRLHQ